MPVKEKFFSFTVKIEFDGSALFDQCGLAIYQNSENWVKTGVEYHDDSTGWLGSVVTNHGYSDWATTDIDAAVKTVWYRLSRRNSDYCLEYSLDGIRFRQMRILHLIEGAEEINIGLMACSPTEGSFKAVFTEMKMTDCLWDLHEE
jgi:regulation of enolase protein 1 (concanavalin A-like superfamily)